MWHITILQYCLWLDTDFSLIVTIFHHDRSVNIILFLKNCSFYLRETKSEKQISTIWYRIVYFNFNKTTFNVNKYSEKHLSICDHVNSRLIEIHMKSTMLLSDWQFSRSNFMFLSKSFVIFLEHFHVSIIHAYRLPSILCLQA